MAFFKLLKKERLVFGVYLLLLIVIIELLLHYFHLPAWPVFLVMIFFFESHMNTSRAPHLLVGAMVGVCCYVLTVLFVELTASQLGVETARLVFICAVVYAIVALGEIVPVVFNNYAFMFYLVSGLAARTDAGPQPLVWLALVAVGGGAVIAAILLINRLVRLTLGAGTAARPSH